MRRITTILCCIAFALGGYFISLSDNITPSGAKTARAAELPTPVIMQYPKDLLLGHRNDVTKVFRDTIRDTIPLEVHHDTITKTVVKYKTKVKWREKKVFEPDTMPRQAPLDLDTLYVSKPVIIAPAVKEEAADTTNLSVQQVVKYSIQWGRETSPMLVLYNRSHQPGYENTRSRFESLYPHKFIINQGDSR